MPTSHPLARLLVALLLLTLTLQSQTDSQILNALNEGDNTHTHTHTHTFTHTHTTHTHTTHTHTTHTHTSRHTNINKYKQTYTQPRPNQPPPCNLLQTIFFNFLLVPEPLRLIPIPFPELP